MAKFTSGSRKGSYTGHGAATADDSVTVEFLRNTQYENIGRKKGPIFREGYQYDFTAEFAARWIKRQAAFDVKIGPPVADDDAPTPPEDWKPLERGGASEGATFKPSELRDQGV